MYMLWLYKHSGFTSFISIIFPLSAAVYMKVTISAVNRSLRGSWFDLVLAAFSSGLVLHQRAQLHYRATGGETRTRPSIKPSLSLPFSARSRPCKAKTKSHIDGRLLWHCGIVASVFQGVGLRSLACWDCWFESQWRHRWMSLVSVVFCQVGFPTTGRSLVQRSPTEYGVSECAREPAIVRRGGLYGAVEPCGENFVFIDVRLFLSLSSPHIYRVIRNDCRGLNNLSHTIHFR